MALTVQRERSSCVGRPFGSPIGSTDSFLDNFYNWITRVPVVTPVAKSTGGPRWYVIDDQSGLPTDPYIVISNHQDVGTGAPDTPAGQGVSENPNKFDDPHKIIKVMELTSSPAEVQFDGYLWWDTTSQIGYQNWFNTVINTVQDNVFVYDFRGGPDFITIGANNNTSWSFQFLGDFGQDSTFVEDRTVAAPISALVAQSVGTPIILNFASAPEASTFTKNKFYFIYDFDGVAKVEYRECTKVGVADGLLATQIEVDQIETAGGFATGAVVAAYAHRLVAWHTKAPAFGKVINLPYVSSLTASSVTRTTQNRLQEQLAMSERGIEKMSPDDMGVFSYDVPYAAELKDGNNNTVADMNRVYGPLTGMFVTSTNGLTQMQIGRVINSLNYLYMEDFQTPQRLITYAFMVPDFDAT